MYNLFAMNSSCQLFHLGSVGWKRWAHGRPNNGFPSVDLRGKRKVYGEVYKIDVNTLWLLDRLEGYPLLYDRSMVITHKNLDVWVYTREIRYYSHIPIIKDGNWREVENEMQEM